ncbi:hypothetical protein TRICI_003722 [Trichomonascus ciferrii]|uniref:Uncharacterized protein n=1 Tax=Trichomonascus ciferrii TaxID=44093 RepID=A0A642V300_9ASCO|nr:hypothetical protein TRICI_003722 [Trichomonascus ciferrii]
MTMFHPILENGGNWFHKSVEELQAQNATLSSLPKKKCLRMIERRLEILHFIRQTHQARRPWINCRETTPQYKWKSMYARRNGTRSFFALGESLDRATNGKTFDDLAHYCSAIMTVLAFYDFYDSKKVAHSPPLGSGASQQPPQQQQQQMDLDNAHRFSSFSSGSSGDTVIPMSPSIRSSISRKLSFAASFSVHSFGSHSPSQSSSALPSPPPEENETMPSAPLCVHSPNPSLAHRPDLLNLPKGKLPSLLTKNTGRMAVLEGLRTPAEDELVYMPDAYQSFVTLIEEFIIIYYKLQDLLTERTPSFLEINEVEQHLETIDKLIRKYSTIEACNHIKNSDIFNSSVCRNPDVLEDAILSY